MNLIAQKLCSIQGRLFELSVKCGFESNHFVRAYMNSQMAANFTSAYDRSQWMGEEYLLDELANGCSLEKGQTYALDVMFWMGYTYAYWAINYVEPCNRIIKMADAKTMASNYAGLHTISVDLAINELMTHFWSRGRNDARIVEEIYKKFLKEAVNSRPNITDYEKYWNELKVDLLFELKNEASKHAYQNQLQQRQRVVIQQIHASYFNYIFGLIDQSNLPQKAKAEYNYMVQKIKNCAFKGGLTKAYFVFLDTLETKLK